MIAKIKSQLRNPYRLWKRKVKNILYRVVDVKALQYEYFPKKVLTEYLPTNPIMLDCGAHDGIDSIELVSTLGGTLHAIEAVPAVYDRLLANTAGNKNISSYNIILADQNGTLDFYVSKGNLGASSSLLKPKLHLIDHPEITFEETLKIKAYTLDSWAAQNHISRIDFMWLDMQGAEQMMLSRSNTIIKTVKAIFCEISTKETYENVPVYTLFKQFMKQIGFRPELEVIPPGTDMGDVLFIRYKQA